MFFFTIYLLGLEQLHPEHNLFKKSGCQSIFSTFCNPLEFIVLPSSSNVFFITNLDFSKKGFNCINSILYFFFLFSIKVKKLLLLSIFSFFLVSLGLSVFSNVSFKFLL